ncbi:MAG: hypothetical protein ABWW65_02600, partial [Thermoprotei archaeon]
MICDNDMGLAIKYVDYRNQGFSLREISSMIQIPLTSLMRRIKRLYKEGFIYKYYNVIFSNIKNYYTYIYVLELRQRISLSYCIHGLKPTLIYYSPLPKPLFILYYLVTRDSLNLDIDTSICRILLGGLVENV